jgi:hypothetical protein
VTAPWTAATSPIQDGEKANDGLVAGSMRLSPKHDIQTVTAGCVSSHAQLLYNPHMLPQESP